jgi:hypothetical protein
VDIEVRKVRDAIEAEFGPEMQRDAITHLWKAYEAAHKAAKDFDPAQRRKVYGHQRLALTEQSFKLFCRKHPHMVAEDHREDGGTYEYFTMASPSLLVTIKAVSTPDRLPPPTTFRDTLAVGINFPLFEEAPAVFGTRKFYHVMLLHNCERKLVRDEDTGDYRRVRILSRPGFVTLAVPERDGKDCIVRASLFRDHPETVAQLRGLNVADVPESQQNKPRARPKTGDGLDTGSK